MGSAVSGSVPQRNDWEQLALFLKSNNLPDIAETVLREKINSSMLREVLDNQSDLIAFFSKYNHTLSINAVADIQETSLKYCDFTGKPCLEKTKSKNEQQSSEPHAPTHRQEEEDQNLTEEKVQDESKLDQIGKTNESTDDGNASTDIEPITVKLEKLNEEMNSVATYEDSQEVLKRWCRDALSLNNIDEVCTLITKNNVLMSYMNDDVAIELGLECILSDQKTLSQRLLALVQETTKISPAIESKIEDAISRDDKQLAKTLCNSVPDNETRNRLLAKLESVDLTPKIKAAIQEGKFEEAMIMSKNSKLPNYIAEEMLGDAILHAAEQNDKARVLNGLKHLPEALLSSVATRSLGACTNLELFKILFQRAVYKTTYADSKIHILKRVGCSQAKRLQVEIANFCIEELRKHLDPNHKKDGIEAPAELCCPITTQIMRNPVKTPAGHRYDRSAITQWVVKFHSDPMTRSPLDTSDLESDTEMKEKVDAWLTTNKTFLRGEKILQDIFSIEWSFGVGWMKNGNIDRVAAKLKPVLGRAERIRLLTSLGIDILRDGKSDETIQIALQIAAMSSQPIDVTVVILDIATRSIKDLEWRYQDWSAHLPPVEALRDVRTVALRFLFAAYSAADDQTSKAMIVKLGNTVAWKMPQNEMQKLRMQLETEYGMSNDHILFPFRCDIEPIVHPAVIN